MHSVAWGLDIGHRAVKGVKLVKTKTGPQVAAFDILPFPQALPKSGPEADEAIREVLTAFVEKHRPRKSEGVAVSMPGHTAFYRPISLPAVEKKKVSQLVQFEARQMIPFPLDEVVWDYQPLGEAGLGEEMEVGLFAIKKEVVHGFLANLGACALNVDVVQVAPLAAYNFLRYERPEDEAMIVLDMGADNTDLIVSDGQKLWLRNLHVAGDTLTRALVEKFRISAEEAEELKRKLDTKEMRESEQGKKIFGVVRPILGDLVSEIQRSIGFYKSQAVEVQFEKILALGNAFRSDVQLAFLRKSLGYEIERVGGPESIETGPGVDGDAFREDALSFGVAIGLGLQCLGLSRMTINLLPPEVLADIRQQGKKPFAMAIAASLLTGLSVSYVASVSRAKDFADVARKIPKETRVFDQDKRDYNRVAGDVAPSSALHGKLADLSSYGAHRAVWPKLLRQLDAVFRAKMDFLWLSQVTAGPIRAAKVPGDPKGGTREELPLSIVGTGRAETGGTYIQKNFLMPLKALPFTRIAEIQSIQKGGPALKGGARLGTGDVKMLQFTVRWVIDVDAFMNPPAQPAGKKETANPGKKAPGKEAK